MGKAARTGRALPAPDGCRAPKPGLPVARDVGKATQLEKDDVPDGVEATPENPAQKTSRSRPARARARDLGHLEARRRLQPEVGGRGARTVAGVPIGIRVGGCDVFSQPKLATVPPSSFGSGHRANAGDAVADDGPSWQGSCLTRAVTVAVSVLLDHCTVHPQRSLTPVSPRFSSRHVVPERPPAKLGEP